MSNIYLVKDILSLSNYAKKYNINYRKIYRYIADEFIEYYMIDDVPYLPDREISILKENHTRNKLRNSVKSLTLSVVSVKSLTQSVENVDNQEVNNVKILTESQKQILETPDIKLSGNNLEKKYKILKLIEKIKSI